MAPVFNSAVFAPTVYDAGAAAGGGGGGVISTAPSVVTNQSFNEWVGRSPLIFNTPMLRRERDIIRVASVVIPAGANTIVPYGGTFDVWYDEVAHSLLVDIKT